MIRKVEALYYRCLRYIDQEINRFNILVGPNASGKSTFLDTISFMSDVVKKGPWEAVEKRSSNYHDMVWRMKDREFKLAIELEIPEKVKKIRKDLIHDFCSEKEKKGEEIPEKVKRERDREPDFILRYEIGLGEVKETKEFGILSETLWFKPKPQKTKDKNRQLSFFPDPLPPPSFLSISPKRRKWKSIVSKVKDGNDNFYAETGVYDYSFKRGPQESALGNLPKDKDKFPITMWFRDFLSKGVQVIKLNSEFMRKPSRPGLPRTFLPDGSNLPWIINDLRKNKESFNRWIDHLKTALPDLKDIDTIERPEDKHRYFSITYKNGLKIPSWCVSDGTLRLLALTILAYLKDIEGIYLIEEPENGIHPIAIETVFQSLSSVYDAQVLLATHSPVIVGIAKPHDILCFARTDEGIVDIINGSEHPGLKEWRGEISLNVLFASGVLD
ncbi:MAG: ATP-binding protein [Candidatus Eremiobacteraeota bacterium]|nr:ATP-binding protein [Candidatus Eremiobacteraeota bacterium]